MVLRLADLVLLLWLDFGPRRLRGLRLLRLLRVSLCGRIIRLWIVMVRGGMSMLIVLAVLLFERDCVVRCSIGVRVALLLMTMGRDRQTVLRIVLIALLMGCLFACLSLRRSLLRLWW